MMPTFHPQTPRASYVPAGARTPIAPGKLVAKSVFGDVRVTHSLPISVRSEVLAAPGSVHGALCTATSTAAVATASACYLWSFDNDDDVQVLEYPPTFAAAATRLATPPAPSRSPARGTTSRYDDDEDESMDVDTTASELGSAVLGVGATTHPRTPHAPSPHGPHVYLAPVDPSFCAVIVTLPTNGELLVFPDPLTAPVHLEIPPMHAGSYVPTPFLTPREYSPIDPIVSVAITGSTVLVATRTRLFALFLGGSNSIALVPVERPWGGILSSFKRAVGGNRAEAEAIVAATAYAGQFYVLTYSNIERWEPRGVARDFDAARGRGPQLVLQEQSAHSLVNVRDLDATLVDVRALVVDDHGAVVVSEIENEEEVGDDHALLCAFFDAPFKTNVNAQFRQLELADPATVGVVRLATGQIVAANATGVEIYDAAADMHVAIEWASGAHELVAAVLGAENKAHFLDVSQGILELVPRRSNTLGRSSRRSAAGGAEQVDLAKTSTDELNSIVYFGCKPSRDMPAISEHEMAQYAHDLLHAPLYVDDDPTTRADQQREYFGNYLRFLSTDACFERLGQAARTHVLDQFLTVEARRAVLAADIPDELRTVLLSCESVAAVLDHLYARAVAADATNVAQQLHFTINPTAVAVVRGITAEDVLNELRAFGVDPKPAMASLMKLVDFNLNTIGPAGTGNRRDLAANLGEAVTAMLDATHPLLAPPVPTTVPSIPKAGALIEVPRGSARRLSWEEAVVVLMDVYTKGAAELVHKYVVPKLQAVYLTHQHANLPADPINDTVLEWAHQREPAGAAFVLYYLTQLVFVDEDHPRALAMGLAFPPLFETFLAAHPPMVVGGLYHLQQGRLHDAVKDLLLAGPQLASVAARGYVYDLVTMAVGALAARATNDRDRDTIARHDAVVRAYLLANDVQARHAHQGVPALAAAGSSADAKRLPPQWVARRMQHGHAVPAPWLAEICPAGNSLVDVAHVLVTIPLAAGERRLALRKLWRRALTVAFAPGNPALDAQQREEMFEMLLDVTQQSGRDETRLVQDEVLNLDVPEVEKWFDVYKLDAVARAEELKRNVEVSTFLRGLKSKSSALSALLKTHFAPGGAE
ncbi:hypothetical protein GGF32_006514 [Allomyces javanicus]|nr:hypothetical protein GGF32_006514 [Allomyces javanicus]